MSQPITTEGIASAISGAVTTHGVSCKCSFVWWSMRSLPRNTTNSSRKLYSDVMNTPLNTAQYATVWPGVVDACTASISASFEKKPEKPGKPINASVPITEVQNVIGMYLHKPPILRMSCSWCIAMITEPAAKNSSALKNACVIKWKMPAAYADAPSATVM